MWETMWEMLKSGYSLIDLHSREKELYNEKNNGVLCPNQETNMVCLIKAAVHPFYENRFVGTR